MLSSILSFIVGPFAPPDARKLGKVPYSSLLLHRISAGEIAVVEPEESFVGVGAVNRWVGYAWERVK